jgi:hypothetical protein
VLRKRNPRGGLRIRRADLKFGLYIGMGYSRVGWRLIDWAIWGRKYGGTMARAEGIWKAGGAWFGCGRVGVFWREMAGTIRAGY